MLHANSGGDTIECDWNRRVLIGPHLDSMRSFALLGMTRHTRQFLTRVIAAAGCLLLADGRAEAIDIEQVEWGFDGQVVAHRFNVLSVLVGNPNPEVFEGVLELHKSIAGAGRVGAILVESVYLAPYSSRWVQFYPYTSNAYEEYTLFWGGGAEQRYGLPKPRVGEPARILLDDPDNLLARGGLLKKLPDNLFPANSTATDSLQAVFIDHVPRWEGARRTSFLEWLRRGGFVHVLRGADGEYPRFSDDMAVLNSPLQRRRIGGGYVIRHNIGRNDVDQNFLKRAVELERRSTRTPGDELDEVAQVKRPFASGAATITEGYFYGISESDWTILGHLKSMSNPDHNWPAIYGLSLIYSLIIFPGCYLLGRRRIDYRLVFGAMLLAVAVFSLMIGLVGRRGYGEATSVHSVAIARPLDKNVCDVTAWSAPFATTGGDYEIVHNGEGRLYSTAQTREAVNRFIDNGAEAVFLADIPPFSSRPFTLRARVECPVPELNVTNWQPGRILRQLAFTTGDGFPDDVNTVHALYRNRIYTLEAIGNEWKLAPKSQPLAVFLQYDETAMQYGASTNPFAFDPFASDDQAPDKRYDALIKPLIARGLGLQDGDSVQKFELLDDRVRVFVYGALPEELYLKNDRFTRQRGRVLYSIDLFGPESQ